MRRRLLLLSLCTLAALNALAQGPNDTGNYYQPANGKKGAQLKTALFNIIKDPNTVSYGGLLQAYKKTDVRADNYLRDWYSNNTYYKPGSDCGNYSEEGDAYNREHLLPQSWYKKATPMRCDIMQVVPTDGYVNNRRSDNPLGEVKSVTWSSANDYSKVGPSKLSGYSGTVFEPNDQMKGDIARAYFYMATCYEDLINSWKDGSAYNVLDTDNGTKLQPYRQWVLDMMMRWSKLDPIDDVERQRNSACEDVQGNRNPFIDYPGLEDYIWGDKQQVAFSYDNYGGDVTIDPTPDPDPDPDPDPQSGEQSTSYTISLNNVFFGCDWTGVRPSGSAIQLSGRQNGISVVYAKGDSGQNMYCNDTQIRLYQHNTLTFSVSSGYLTRIEFTTENNPTKPMYASTGTVSDYTWTGHAREVQFTVEEGSGHVRLKSAAVTVEQSEISTSVVRPHLTVPHPRHDLMGRKLRRSHKGFYIQQGKKFVAR